MTWVNNNLLPFFWVCLGSYLLGCVTVGYYLVRFVAHRDIRAEGSGSLGARNVGRLLGAWGFATVLLSDLGKGALAVWLACRFTGGGQFALPALLAVTVGHVWPVQLKFRGGKGVSTSLGALLVFDWRVALTFAAVAGLIVLLLRRFTLGGLIAFALLPLLAMAWRENPASVFGLLILSAFVLFTHRKNLEEELFQPKPEGKP
jgi:acyl phosphate:glycerol-3-phosphate acyltransferase